MFRYGVVVLFDVAPLEQARFLDDLERFVIEPVAVDEREDEQAELRAGQENERAHLAVISLRSFEVERLQIVADVLAKSVVLAHYEERIGEVFGLVEPLAHELSSGSTRRRSRELLRHIGNTLLIQTKTVGMVEIADKPELLWERPDLELLYTRLADEYELDERHHALERKLAVVEHTATTALQLLQHNSSLRVEWYIVLLIVVEIVLTLIGMFG